MLVKWHVLFGALFSIVLYFLFNLSLLDSTIIFLASFLIDVDHYFLYVIVRKDYSIMNANRWILASSEKFDSLPLAKRKRLHQGYFIFHSIEFLIPFFLASLMNKYLMLVFIGFIFHIIVDMIYELFFSKRAVYKISIIYTILTRKFIEYDYPKTQPLKKL